MHPNNIWSTLLYELLQNGQPVGPRGKPTKEFLGRQSRVDMSKPVVTMMERQLGYRFMAAEAAWILGGDNRVSTITNYAKAIKNFSDDGLTFFGAYGPMIRSQLPHIIKALRDDIDTRQAVLTIWRPSPPASLDIPCTVSLQFLARGRRLNCVATMRSSDAWLGVPYDWFNFSMISLYMLLHMRQVSPYFKDIKLGSLFFTAGSQHLYQENWEQAYDITSSLVIHPEFSVKPIEADNFCSPDHLTSCLWHVANGKEPDIDFLSEFKDHYK